jgi:hypothetical protein
MRRMILAVMVAGLMALGACASSKPCPAYAEADSLVEAKG